MQNVFVSNIVINKVRHLENVEISLPKDKLKHLIITGKNGSGKTSLLDAIATFLNSMTRFEHSIEERIGKTSCGVKLELNQQLPDVHALFQEGKFIVAYYKADRVFKAQVPKHVEKIELKNNYSIQDSPREEFIKYLLDLKMTEALARANGKNEKADRIKKWFEELQELLKEIFEDDSVRLEFDEDSFKFTIHMEGREPFDFNTLSSGFAAVLEIVVDLMFRMEKQTNKVFDYSLPGIVLIDEIETHLHLELQKKIMNMLTTIFPNIQFIVSTHSPFILNSLENAAIYDLENKLFVEEGLADVPYGGIVEGYFKADAMSVTLRDKYNRYKEFVKKAELSDEDMDEITELEMYLNEIPDYLALNITTEYQRLKQQLRMREDI